jgi:hypothetical protein
MALVESAGEIQAKCFWPLMSGFNSMWLSKVRQSPQSMRLLHDIMPYNSCIH